MNSTIYISRDDDGNVSVVPIPGASLRKSVGGRPTIAVTVVDLVQMGKSEMTTTERYLNGNQFMAMLPRPVTMLTDEPTLREIRALMMAKSVEAAAELDAGRGRLADILAMFPSAILKGGESLAEYDADGNVVGEQPLQKAVDRTMFDGLEVDRGIFNGQLLRKGGGLELVRLAYEEHAHDPATSASDLKKAADELDAIAARLNK